MKYTRQVSIFFELQAINDRCLTNYGPRSISVILETKTVLYTQNAVRISVSRDSKRINMGGDHAPL